MSPNKRTFEARFPARCDRTYRRGRVFSGSFDVTTGRGKIALDTEESRVATELGIYYASTLHLIIYCRRQNNITG